MRRIPAYFHTVVLSVTLTASACGSESVPRAPLAPQTPDVLGVSLVSPSEPFAGDDVSVMGTGFVAGAQVRLGGLATTATFRGPSQILVRTPANGTGTVDVVVTNPDGQSVTLPAALTYNAVTISASPTVVAPGGEVTIGWTALRSRCSLDWIAMYLLTASDFDYGPWQYTSCGTSGTVRLNAPTVRGQYDVRYLRDDGIVVVTRSASITVD